MLGSGSPRVLEGFWFNSFLLWFIFVVFSEDRACISLSGTPWTMARRAKIPEVHAHQMQDIADIAFMHFILHAPL